MLITQSGDDAEKEEETGLKERREEKNVKDFRWDKASPPVRQLKRQIASQPLQCFLKI